MQMGDGASRLCWLPAGGWIDTEFDQVGVLIFGKEEMARGSMKWWGSLLPVGTSATR
jgi:hypothetical protein